MIKLRHAFDIVHELKRYDAFDGGAKNVIAKVDAVDADVEAVEADENVKCEGVAWKVGEVLLNI